MTDEEKLIIGHQGAAARAAGTDRMRNPFYKAENMPAATGETAEEWEKKLLIWDTGWNIEDLMRGGKS